MSALRTVRCPDCGAENLLGKRCPCGKTAKDSRRRDAARRLGRAIGVMLTFAVTASIITAASTALANATQPAWGLGLAFGMWCFASLWRLGHDWDDGIDVWRLMFPAPLDWGVKWERFLNFWTDDRPYFRAVHLACIVATIVMLIIASPDLR